MYANPRKLRRPEQRVGTLFNAALPPPQESEHRLVHALRSGDERSFERVVAHHTPALLRLAMHHVRSPEEAEEVVQETWLALLKGIHRFEGRSSFRTWLYRILLNRARTRGRREARSVPFSALGAEPVVSATLPAPWLRADADPERRFLEGELRRRVEAAVAALPPQQRAVITLRDLEGRSAAETCRALDVSAGNQRVLLHRARQQVRAALRTSRRRRSRARLAPQENVGSAL